MCPKFVISALLTGLMLPQMTWAADATLPQSGAEESLGSGLLDDLGTDLAKDQPESGRKEMNGDTDTPPLQPRFDDLGEDVGVSAGALSLVRIRQGMHQAVTLLVTQRIAPNKAGVQQAGAVQQQVVEQLDKLIAELSKQCQCCGQCPGGDKLSEPGPPKQSKSGKPKSATGKGQTAARDSTTQLGSSPATRLEKGEVEILAKKLWGHLPQRDREQMMQSFTEEFLPQYEADLEQYYRRLSEEPDDTATP